MNIINHLYKKNTFNSLKMRCYLILEKYTLFKKYLLFKKYIFNSLKRRYFCILGKFRTKPSRKKVYLSICAIVKNEGADIKEWIEFHKLVGVERFYIYDNNSTDNTREILKPYIKSEEVIMKKWRIRPIQLRAYDDCLQRVCNETTWLAFIDADEFLFGTKEDNIKKLLQDYEQYPGVVVNWLVFGSSGYDKKPEGLVIEKYNLRGHLSFKENNVIKSIVQPKLTISTSLNPHNFIYKKKSQSVNEEFKPFVGNASMKNSTKKLRINHYSIKSKEEFIKKKERGDSMGGIEKGNDYFIKMDKNEIKDKCILRFLDRLKNNIAK